MRKGIFLAILAGTMLAGTAAKAQSVGDVVSSNVQDWLGNTTNPRPSGHGVLPSLAPGPWKCVYDASGACVAQTNGGSPGEFISPFLSNGKSKADFANRGLQPNDCSDDPDPKPGTSGCPVP
jgi:hypothetical protein